MKKILVLGAGYVCQPLVKYLLNLPDINLTIASRTLEKAKKITNNHPFSCALELDVNNQNDLKQVIEQSDLVISVLPWIYHLNVAKLCLEFGKHLVTTSYIKPEMQAFDLDVKKKGLIFLNEIGVDPGIDHMAAMKVIHRVQKAKGEIISFYSYCGGLPSIKDNNNPLGYKFSWSPKGVLLAADNNGRYLKDNKIIEISKDELFKHYWLIDIPGAGTYESYVNRDALPYKEIYGIQSAQSIYRGTLRNISHCESWDYFKKLGLLNQDIIFDFQKISPFQALCYLIHSNGKDLVKDIAGFLNIPQYSITIKKLEWLGLLSTQLLDLHKVSVFDMFAHVLQNKLVYHDNEQDVLIQHHEFIAQYPDKKEKITSTMVETGIPGGHSAMSRTVGLPAAIGTKLILNNKIKTKGVLRPVLPEIYEPVLSELETMNIKLAEKRLK